MFRNSGLGVLGLGLFIGACGGLDDFSGFSGVSSDSEGLARATDHSIAKHELGRLINTARVRGNLRVVANDCGLGSAASEATKGRVVEPATRGCGGAGSQRVDALFEKAERRSAGRVCTGTGVRSQVVLDIYSERAYAGSGLPSFVVRIDGKRLTYGAIGSAAQWQASVVVPLTPIRCSVVSLSGDAIIQGEEAAFRLRYAVAVRGCGSVSLTSLRLEALNADFVVNGGTAPIAMCSVGNVIPATNSCVCPANTQQLSMVGGTRMCIPTGAGTTCGADELIPATNSCACPANTQQLTMTGGTRMCISTGVGTTCGADELIPATNACACPANTQQLTMVGGTRMCISTGAGTTCAVGALIPATNSCACPANTQQLTMNGGVRMCLQ